MVATLKQALTKAEDKAAKERTEREKLARVILYDENMFHMRYATLV